MKKYLKKLLVVALALMPSLSINTFAQDPGSGNDNTDEIPIVIIHEGTTPRLRDSIDTGSGEPISIKTHPIRPRSLPGDVDPIPVKPIPDPNPNPYPGPRGSAQTPYCYYANGVVYIDADITITYIIASITRSYDNLIWSGTSATNTLSINASSDVGEYLLELTLSNGLSYIGKYIIE